MPDPTLFPVDLRDFVDSAKWTFAKTMPEWPHEYIVRERVDEELFVTLVQHIREYGYEGKFYSKTMTYYDEDDRVYWTMGAPLDETIIVNRCKKEDSYESRLRNGLL
jgi:hypothetical protein